MNEAMPESTPVTDGRAQTFPHGAVASPHHLASAVGQRILADGGNAVDAVVATGLALAVVSPYFCGLGGDLLAIVWDGQAHGLFSIGRAPAAATPDAIRAALGDTTPDSQPNTAGMPKRGPLAVTVPGAVDGWLHLLASHGTMSLGTVAAPAIALAEHGFVVSAMASATVESARAVLSEQPGWSDHYGRMRAGERFLQPALAGTLRAIATNGRDALYRGRVAEEIVEVLNAHGSTMTLADLAAHEVEWVTPLSGRYRDLEVLELPPPTQGVTALTALALVDALGPLPADPVDAMHRQIEAVRAAMADREEHVGDPATMRTSAAALLEPQRIAALAGRIDPAAAAPWPPARPSPGGTAYLCASDRDGLVVSLIQSNFMGFGSGVVVPRSGFGLHNRGAHFSLDPAAANAIGPNRRPLHTLIPGLALMDGRPRYVFGTMGGDGQAQIHLQVLSQLVDRGADVGTAVSAPRFIVDVASGDVALDPDIDESLADGLRARGHIVTRLKAARDAGHAHAIEITDAGSTAASDPRCEGAALGI